ncbi:hypothetical protein E2C01_093589 [Portunus trituberculatus]|uniref:Uncharacterized protein n=1 Tax=Portunus trituberculatus TaxID=210409 RepID=A0A5B7JN44_PORTR|nr:hypothetical protein [Portunus trituberculatus]
MRPSTEGIDIESSDLLAVFSRHTLTNNKSPALNERYDTIELRAEDHMISDRRSSNTHSKHFRRQPSLPEHTFNHLLIQPRPSAIQ